jgi:energy-coupling factor transporter ATP-binding protein EcfA2
MITTIVLFGPTGSGKSTLVKAAKAVGVRCIDLEAHGRTPDERRAAAMFITETAPIDRPALIGAADTDVTIYPPSEFLRLLLLPPLPLFREMAETGESRRSRSLEREHLDHYASFVGSKSDFDIVFDDEAAFSGGPYASLLRIGVSRLNWQSHFN